MRQPSSVVSYLTETGAERKASPDEIMTATQMLTTVLFKQFPEVVNSRKRRKEAIMKNKELLFQPHARRHILQNISHFALPTGLEQGSKVMWIHF